MTGDEPDKVGGTSGTKWVLRQNSMTRRNAMEEVMTEHVEPEWTNCDWSLRYDLTQLSTELWIS